MKPADFLINKANEYITFIDEISQNLVKSEPQANDFGFSTETPEFIEQQEKLSEFYLKVRLLFSEVENGNLFLTYLEDHYNDFRFVFHENEKLAAIKRVLNLFAEHIKEFKK